jgi:hypothetical protein
MDYSFLKTLKGAFPKGPTREEAVEAARAARTRVDNRESQKVRRRSKGQCEVTVDGARCLWKACQVHHHEGGNGRRGRGSSALSANKTHTCVACHNAINRKRLIHISGNRYRWKV